MQILILHYDFRAFHQENVFFSHENSNTKILQNICLEIKVGQKVAIIGKSGSGKSTMIDLILGDIFLSLYTIGIKNSTFP